MAFAAQERFVNAYPNFDECMTSNRLLRDTSSTAKVFNFIILGTIINCQPCERSSPRAETDDWRKAFPASARFRTTPGW